MPFNLRYAVRRARAGWVRRWRKRPPLEARILQAYLRQPPPPEPEPKPEPEPDGPESPPPPEQ